MFETTDYFLHKNVLIHCDSVFNKNERTQFHKYYVSFVKEYSIKKTTSPDAYEKYVTSTVFNKADGSQLTTVTFVNSILDTLTRLSQHNIECSYSLEENIFNYIEAIMLIANNKEFIMDIRNDLCDKMNAGFFIKILNKIYETKSANYLSTNRSNMHFIYVSNKKLNNEI